MKRLIRRWSAKQSGMFGTFGLASAIGLHLVSGVIVGGLLGYWLDKWLGTSPWLKIIFFVLGIAAGFRNVYLDAKILIKAQEEEYGKQPWRNAQPEKDERPEDEN